MKKIILVLVLLISSVCFAQRDSTLYKALNSELPKIQKQIDESKELNLALINLYQQLKDYQSIVLFIQQYWYQQELRTK